MRLINFLYMLIGQTSEDSGKLTLDTVLDIAIRILNAEIVRVEDKPLTIRNFIIAIFVFVVGFYSVRFLSKWFTSRLVKKFRQDPALLATIQTLLFYVLILFVLFFSLSIANIPLTVFTVAGGALAIGIGFGSQNILKNFISGIILMLDRPIKVGDFIEIHDTFGEVENIGFRSTRLAAYGNVHRIFPNSIFLENDFINWTLMDPTVRISVRVGVAYGSDTEKVKELLLDAAKENEGVLKFPEPNVLFQDFGDSALIFDLYFTIRMQNLADRRKRESELRFAIDKKFRDGKVVIAFPQMDVHLHGATPVQLESNIKN